MEEQEHQVPSLFTFALVQLIVAALLFFSLLNNQRELALLSLLVLGVIGGARLWANASLSRVECHLTLDKLRVFPAEPISLRVTVDAAADVLVQRGYFEAIIQLRGDRSKMDKYADMFIKRLQKKTFITRTEEKDEGSR